MATMTIKGTERKIEFLTDILCDSPPKWEHITMIQDKITLVFKDIDDAKVMAAMYKRLQTRKDLGIF